MSQISKVVLEVHVWGVVLIRTEPMQPGLAEARKAQFEYFFGQDTVREIRT